MYLLMLLFLFLNPAKAQSVDTARLEACQREWRRLPQGYFVLNAQEACTRYARIAPNTDTNRCIERAMGTRPTNRDYYTNFDFIAKLCQENPALDETQTNCMRQALARGGDAARIFHQCDPQVANCKARLERLRPSRGVRATRDLYHDFCVSYPQDEEMGACVANTVHTHRSLATKPKVLQDLCHEKARPCATRLRQVLTDPNRASADQLEEISKLCYRSFYDEKPVEWAECNFRLRAVEQIPARETPALCEIKNLAGRQCIVDFFKQGRSIAEGTLLCRYPEGNVRQCLLRAFQRTGEFTAGAMQGLSHAVLEQYCALDGEAERDCFTHAMATESPRSESDQLARLQRCREQSTSYRQCVEDFNEYYERNLFLNATRDMGAKICALPSHDMRLCMLNSILAKKYIKPKSMFSQGNTMFPYDEYYQQCLGRFLGLLLRDLHEENLWGCRYSYFTNLSLWDKAWYCSTASSERLCREFTSALRARSNDELRRDCEMIGRDYYNSAERSYGNPLWHLCRERRLIPLR